MYINRVFLKYTFFWNLVLRDVDFFLGPIQNDVRKGRLPKNGCLPLSRSYTRQMLYLAYLAIFWRVFEHAKYGQMGDGSVIKIF